MSLVERKFRDLRLKIIGTRSRDLKKFMKKPRRNVVVKEFQKADLILKEVNKW